MVYWSLRGVIGLGVALCRGGKPRLRKQAMQGLTKVVVNICVILSRLVMVMFFEMFRLRRENAQMSSLSR